MLSTTRTRLLWMAARHCRKVSGLLALLTILVLNGRAADVIQLSASKLTYRNNGGYAARAFVRWNRGGSNCEADPFANKPIFLGESRTANLANSSDWKLTQGSKTNCLLPILRNQEVWIKVKIDGGESKSCRKDNAKFYHYPLGGEVTYTTAGTVTLGNKCTVEKVPDTAWPY